MTARPLVSVAIASFNSARYLEPAVNSALAQSLSQIEVIIVDDASSDDSVSVARRLAERDVRVRVDILPENRGPGGARNRALHLARGRWLAVLDSDDLWHPDRLSRLISGAENDLADIVADNLLMFADEDASAAASFLQGVRSRRPTEVTIEDYLAETRILVSKANLGYLKPVFNLEKLRATGVAYDEAMRIGEDDDFLLRLLSAGMRARVYPDLTYFYRRHTGSISHRLSASTMGRIAAQEAKFRADLVHPPPRLLSALDRRRRAIRTAEGFVALVDALKRLRLDTVAEILVRQPRAALLLRLPLVAAIKRAVIRWGWKPRPLDHSSPSLKVCLISRQRIVGATNGSSAYILDMIGAVRDAGMEVHLVQPSPVVLGRWPLMRLKAETDVFETIRIRGAIRWGRWVVARDPRIYASALRAILARALKTLKVPTNWLGAKPAPYAIAAPWVNDDYLFVAKHCPPLADRVLVDYAFQTEALPYVLRPGTPSAVVMHDLFHSRVAAFDAAERTDSVATLTADEEGALLSRVDAVIAIQEKEADWLRRNVEAAVVLAPIAARASAHAQPGQANTLLFVGSNTAPNVIGLKWFFEAVWPNVRLRNPKAILKVAGNVSRSFESTPEGVVFLGVVANLDAIYAEAAVVISPLTLGSGLKIKLIEALARGKAIVATSVTVQGVEAQTAGAVIKEDDAIAFAEAILGLLDSKVERTRLAELALSTAERCFSPAACYGPLIAWLSSRGGDGPSSAA